MNALMVTAAMLARRNKERERERERLTESVTW